MKIKFLQKKTVFRVILVISAAAVLFSYLSGCSQGPTEQDVYTAYISYRLAEPTTQSVEFSEGSTTDGVGVYNYTNVAEPTYGYSFNGLVRDTFTVDTHSFWGMLTVTGGAVTNLVLNYTNTAGVFTGTITGDTTAIDLSTLDMTVLPETPAEEPAP